MFVCLSVGNNMNVLFLQTKNNCFQRLLSHFLVLIPPAMHISTVLMCYATTTTKRVDRSTASRTRWQQLSGICESLVQVFELHLWKLPPSARYKFCKIIIQTCLPERRGEGAFLKPRRSVAKLLSSIRSHSILQTKHIEFCNYHRFKFRFDFFIIIDNCFSKWFRWLFGRTLMKCDYRNLYFS